MSLTVSLTFADEEEGRAFAAAAASAGRVLYHPGTGEVLWEEQWPALKSVTQLATVQSSFIPDIGTGVASVTTGHLAVGTSHTFTTGTTLT